MPLPLFNPFQNIFGRILAETTLAHLEADLLPRPTILIPAKNLVRQTDHYTRYVYICIYMLYTRPMIDRATRAVADRQISFRFPS